MEEAFLVLQAMEESFWYGRRLWGSFQTEKKKLNNVCFRSSLCSVSGTLSLVQLASELMYACVLMYPCKI